jgi:hypothetical protein
MLCMLWSVYYGQQQYIAYFTPPSDFSDYGYAEYGPDTVVNDFTINSIRQCKFYNGMSFYPAQAFYSKTGMSDLQAATLAPNYDSLVFKFKYKTSGYAKNFNIKCEFLANSGGGYAYNFTKNYNGNDSANVTFKYSFATNYQFNWKILLTKQDTTLNNFTVYLSNIDIKGYLHYGRVGLNELTKSDTKIYWNNQTIFFDEKWMDKKYWINDIYGKIIFSGIVNSTLQPLNLENGLYILNTEKSSQKMIINNY